jgi:hypothetical protein
MFELDSIEDPTFTGSLDDLVWVHIDPISDKSIRVPLKGREIHDAAAYYCPYIPVKFIPLKVIVTKTSVDFSVL